MLKPAFENLRAQRILKKRTQREVAEAIGLAQPSYCLIESGRRRLTVEQARLAAIFLGIPLSRIAPLKDAA